MKKLIVVLVIVSNVGTAAHSNAQPKLQDWIYAVVQNTDRLEIIRLSAADDTIEDVYATPNTVETSLEQLLSFDELTALTAFFQPATALPDQKKLLLSSQPFTIYQHLVVSPDQRYFATVLLKQSCIRYPRYECFGMTKLQIFSTQDMQEVQTWETGLHDRQYFKNTCPSSTFTHVEQLRWTLDSSSLIVALGGDALCMTSNTNYAIVAIPVDKTAVPFQIADAITWTTTSVSDTIASIRRDCDLAQECTDIFESTQFEVVNGTVERTDIPLPEYLYVNRAFGIAKLQELVIFATLDRRTDNGAVFSILDSSTQLSSKPIDSSSTSPFVHISSSPNGQSVLLETLDKTLWQLKIEDGEPKLTEFYSNEPIESWQWGDDDTVLVQTKDISFVLSPSVEILVTSNVRERLQRESKLQSDSMLLAITW